jgi:hypothetical protein
VDQPEFVVQVAPNRVDVDEFNRWDAPLNDGIARAVAGDLIYLTTLAAPWGWTRRTEDKPGGQGNYQVKT